MDSTKIDNIVTTFLIQNDIECVATMDTDFAYYYAHSLITYSLVVSERMDKLFMNFAKHNGLKVDCGIFILSLLHEAGHDATLEEIDDDEMAYSQDMKAILTDSDNDCETYFNLPDEYEATMWAIDFINNNVDRIEKFARELQIALADFYKENEISA